MDDILKIILTAQFDDNSWANIVKKIKAIRNALKDVKIKITEEGNFSQNLQKLVDNLEALNKKMSELSKEQIKDMERIREQSKKNAKDIKDDLDQEQREVKELKDDYEDLLKTKQKTGKGAKTEIVRGNRIKQETVSKDAEGNISRTVTTNVEKARAEKEKMRELNKRLISQEGELTENQRKFLDLYSKLDHKAEDYVDTSQKINKVYDDIIERERKYQQLLERREQTSKQIADMQRRGADPRTYASLETANRNLDPKRVFYTQGGKERKDDVAQRAYEKVINDSNRALERSIELERNLARVTEIKNDAERKAQKLRERGYDTSELEKIINTNVNWTKSSEEVNEGLQKITKAIKNMEQGDKIVSQIDNQMRKLGLTIDSTFKNLNATGDVEGLKAKMTEIQQRILQLKAQGVALDQREIDALQRMNQQLRENLETRQQEARVANERAKEQTRIRGDRKDQYSGARVENVFADRSSYLNREQGARELARQYLQEQRGLADLDDELARVTTSTDRFGREQMRVSYEVRGTSGEVQRYTVNIDQATNALYDMGRATRQVGDNRGIMDRFADSLARVPAYLATFGVAYEVLNQVQQSFRIIYEVDEALTDLAKVTDATTSELEAFRIEASQIGQELGSTTAEVTKAIAEFQKLGYTFEQSKQLGETALVYANVGDMDVEDSTKNLTSALKGFGVAQEDVVEESQRYVDIFNEVGNRYAVTSAGLGEALRRSSAQLYEAGNTVEQSVAMITSANAVIQDEKKVGTAMKTVSMRLRGVADEGEEVTNLMPKLAGAFEDVGIQLTDTNGNFKSTFEVMGELAKVWNTNVVSEMERANLVELIAGKHHATVVSAMLNNWTDATNSYQTALDSAGSASLEFSKYQESLVYRVDRLKATYEEFWLAFWDDEAIKAVITGITGVLKILATMIEQFGAVGFAISAMLPPLLLFNRTLRTTFIMGTVQTTRLRQAIAGLSWSLAGARAGVTALAVAFRGLMIASVIGIAIAVAIQAVVWVVDKAIGSHQKYIDTLKDEYEAQKAVADQLEGIDFEKYYVLENKQNTTGLGQGELAEYTEMQERLKNSGADVISHYNEQGEAVLKSAEALLKLNEQKREELRLSREKMNEAQKDVLTGDAGWRKNLFQYDEHEGNRAILNAVNMGSPVDEFADDVKKLEDEKRKLLQFSKEIEGLKLAQNVISSADLGRFKSNSAGFKAEIKTVQDELKRLRDTGQISDRTFTEARMTVGAYTPTAGADLGGGIEDIIERIENQSEKLEQTVSESESKISDAFKDLGNSIETDFENFLDTSDIDVQTNAYEIANDMKEAYLDAFETGNFDDMKGALNDVEKHMAEVFNAIEGAGINLEDLATGSPVAVAELERLSGSMNLTGNSANLLASYITYLNQQIASTEGAVAQQQAFANQIQTQRNQLISEYTDKANFLAQVYQQVADGQGLELSQIAELTTKYPELNAQIETHNGVMSIKKEAIALVAEQHETSFKDEVNILIAETEAHIKNVKDFITGNEVKVKSLDFLNQAMVKSAKVSADSMAQQMADAQIASVIADNINNKNFKWSQESQAAFRNRAVSYYKNQLVGQAEASLKSLESELAGLRALKGADLTSHVQKTTAPLKQDKPDKQEKEKKATEELIYVTDKFKEAMRELNAQIREQQDIMEQYPTYSKEYQNALKNELGLIGQKISKSKEEAENIQRQINQREIQKTGLVKKNEATVGGGGGGGGGGVTTRTLRVGSRGEDVKALQRKLGITADGIYGNQTANAVRNFQRSKGLSVDGIAGRQTLGALGLYGTGGGKATGGGGISRNLKVGSRGEDVKALQRALGITADGIFGNQTANAVRNFQRSKGLSADAIAGQQTLTALGLWGAGGGGVDQRNAEAQLQEAIDKAKDEKEQMLEDVSKLRAEYNTKLNELFGAVVSGVEHDAKKMEDELAVIELKSERVAEDSTDWRELQSQRLKILQTQEVGRNEAIVKLQEELTKGEHELNEKLEEGLYDLIDEQKIGLINIQQEIFQLQREIQESVINEIVKNYEEEMEDYDRAIKKIQNQQERFAETDLDKYAEANLKISRIIETQIELNKDRIAQLEAEEEKVKQFPDLYEEWKNQIEDLQDSQDDLNQQLYETQRDTLDRQEEAVDELIDLYKEYYEQRMDLELEALDKQREAEEKLSDERMERWEKEAQKYEEIVSEQIEALDNAENERQYEKDLAKRQQTRQDILEQIGLVSLDTSAEGRARLNQLKEELKNISEEISETIRQKQIEERRKALEEQLNARQEETDKIMEAEDDRLEKEMNMFDEREKEIEDKWENIIENERKFAQIREDILAGNISEMTSQIETFVNLITASSSEMGEAISQNLIDKFINAKKELEELDGALTDSQINFNQEHGSTANNWYKQEGIITPDMINDKTITQPKVYWIYPQTPELTGTMTPASNITVNMTVGSVTGGQEGADELMKAIANGLASKGVTLG